MATPTRKGPIRSILLAADASGESTTQTFTIQVDAQQVLDETANSTPTFNAPRSEIGVGQQFVYKIEATDADDDPIALSVTWNAPGMTFDETTRTLSWVPTVDNILPFGEEYSITVTADDQRGLLNSVYAPEPFSLVVTGTRPINHAPVIKPKQYPSAVVGNPYRIQFEATDEDGDALFWSLEESPDSSIGFNSATGELIWTPGDEHIGLKTVRVRVFDALGAYSEAELQIAVRGVNSPLQLRNFNPPRIVEFGESVSYQIDAADLDNLEGPLTYQLFGEGSLPKPTELDWLTVDSQSGLLIGTAPSTIDEQRIVELHISDGGFTLIQPFTIEVVDPAGAGAINQFPIFDSSPKFVPFIDVVTPYEHLVLVNDPDGSISSLQLTSTTLGTSLVDNLDGTWTVFWDTTDAALVVGPQYEMTLVATDNEGATTTQQSTFTLNANAPLNSAPRLRNFDPPRIVETDEVISYQVDAIDPDNQIQPLSYDLTGTGGAAITIGWLNIDAKTGLISGQAPSSPTSAPIDLELRIFDGEFTLVQPFDIQVVAQGSPVANEFPKFNSSPDFVPFIDGVVPYEHLVLVNDPDGTIASLQLTSTTLGMSLVDNLNGTWTVFWDTTEPTLAVGPQYEMTLKATDNNGAVTIQRTAFTLNAAPPANDPPSFVDPLPTGSYDAIPGARFELPVFATDPEGGPVFFTIASQTALPAGMEFVRTSDRAGRIVWDVPTDELIANTAYMIDVDIVDQLNLAGDNGPQSFAINIVQDAIAPTVSLRASENAVPVGTNVLFFITATDNVGVADVGLTAVGDLGGSGTITTPISVNSDYTASQVFNAIGTYTITTVATDASGLQTTDSVEVFVYDPATAAIPTAEIVSVSDTDGSDDGVLSQTASVIFSVGNDSSSTVTYLLELVDIHSGQTIHVLEDSTGTQTSKTADKSIEPTALPNGQYLLRLTAENEFGIPAVDQRVVEIDSGPTQAGQFCDLVR